MKLLEIFDIGPILFEKRRNPDVNAKQDSLEALKKYRGQKNVFVSYTADVGAASHAYKSSSTTSTTDKRKVGSGAKLGINPNLRYDTPLGIYAYPIDEVLELKGEVPFAGEQPFIQVFRADGNLLDTNEYSSVDLRSDIKKIKAAVKDKSFNPDRAIEAATIQNAAGQLWNVTRVAAQYIARDIYVNDPRNEHEHLRSSFGAGSYDYNMPKIDYGDDGYEEEENADEEQDDDEYDQEFYTADAVFKADMDGYEDEGEDEDEEDYDSLHSEDDEDEDDVKESLTEAIVPVKQPIQWSALMRKTLGYDGVVDHGYGIIHENEPTQAVFFSKNKIRQLELIDNIHPADMDQKDLWRMKPRLFIDAVNAGKLSAETIIYFMSEYAQIIDYPTHIGAESLLKFSALPEKAQDWVIEKEDNFWKQGLGLAWMEFVPMTDEKLISILQKKMSRINAFTKDQFTKPVMDFLAQNILTLIPSGRAADILPYFDEDQKLSIGLNLADHISKLPPVTGSGLWEGYEVLHFIHNLCGKMENPDAEKVMAKTINALAVAAPLVLWYERLTSLPLYREWMRKISMRNFVHFFKHMAELPVRPQGWFTFNVLEDLLKRGKVATVTACIQSLNDQMVYDLFDQFYTARENNSLLATMPGFEKDEYRKMLSIFAKINPKFKEVLEKTPDRWW